MVDAPASRRRAGLRQNCPEAPGSNRTEDDRLKNPVPSMWTRAVKEFLDYLVVTFCEKKHGLVAQPWPRHSKMSWGPDVRRSSGLWAIRRPAPWRSKDSGEFPAGRSLPRGRVRDNEDPRFERNPILYRIDGIRSKRSGPAVRISRPGLSEPGIRRRIDLQSAA